MTDNIKKHPVLEGLENMEDILKREHTIKDLESVVQRLGEDVATDGLLDKAEEAEKILIREKVTAVLKQIPSGKETKKVRRGLKKIEASIGEKVESITEEASLSEVPMAEEAKPTSAPVTPEIPALSTVKTIRPLNKMGLVGIKRLNDSLHEKLEKLARDHAPISELQDIQNDLRALNEYYIKRFGQSMPETKPKPVSATGPTNPKSAPNAPEIKEKEIAKDQQLKISEITEISDDEFRQMSDKIAPQEYKNWCDLFQSLHYVTLPVDERARNSTIDFIKRTLGVADSKEYDMLKDALLKTAFREYMEAANPIIAMRKVLEVNGLNDKNLAKKINDKIEALKAAISDIKATIKEKNAPKTAASRAKAPQKPSEALKYSDAELRKMDERALKRIIAVTLNDRPELKADYPKIAEEIKIIRSSDEWQTNNIEAQKKINDIRIRWILQNAKSANEAKAPVTVKPAAPEPPAQKLNLRELIGKAPDDEKVFLTAVEAYLHDNPADERLFADALKLTKIESDDPLVTDLQERIKKLFSQKQAVLKKATDSKQPIVELFKGGLKPIQEEIAKTLELWNDKEFYMLLGLGKINEEVRRIYAVLGVNPKTVKNLQKRKYLEDIQEEIQAELSGIKLEYSPEKLKKLRLKERMKETEKIAQKLHELNDYINFFESEILPELPGHAQAIYRGEKVKKVKGSVLSLTPAVSMTVPSAPIASPIDTSGPVTVQTATPAPGATPAASTAPASVAPADISTAAIAQADALTTANVADKKGGEVKKTTETAENAKIWEMLGEVINDKKLINKNNPVCLAIYNLISKPINEKGEKIDIHDLLRCLKNPDQYFKDVDTIDFGSVREEMRLKVQSEMTLLGVDTFEKLVKELDKEKKLLEKENQQLEVDEKNVSEDLNGIYQRFKNKSIPDDEKLKETEMLAQKAKIRQRQLEIRQRITFMDETNRNVAVLDKLQTNSMKYDSPRDVLQLINLYIFKKGEGSIDDLSRITNEQIAEARKTTDKWSNTWLSKCTFFLKPTLKSTLMALGEDPEFASDLGKDAGNKLAELAAMKFPYKTTEIDNWITSIGGKEKNIHTTIPRLIVYLERAIHEGKASSLIITRRARKLADYLRSVQHDYWRDKINSSSKTPREKMMEYVETLRKSSHHEIRIKKELLKNNVLQSSVLRTVALGGAGVGIGAGLLASAPVVAGALGALGLTGLADRYLRKTPLTDKERAGLAKGAVRATVASTLGIAGGLIAGVYALPVGLAAATIGLLSPEIGKGLWKHRRGAAKAGLKTAKGAGKLGGKALLATGTAMGATAVFLLKALALPVSAPVKFLWNRIKK